MIRAVGVVVPARDEEALLPSCLAAVKLAARMLPRIPVHLVVVADRCGDRTASLAARAGAIVVEGSMTGVGHARRTGAEVLLHRTRALDPSTVWIATTDADTLVPPCWLSRQLEHASRGWEAVVGTVTVTDWAGRPAPYRAAYAEHYARGIGAPADVPADGDGMRAHGASRWHSHVHGANLGVTAAAYLAVGGFRPLPTGEDHALVGALESAGRRVLRTTGVTVTTSARHDPRAPDGFGDFLARLGHEAVPGMS
ncbi:glycosyltransferase [Streptosporangium sp. DT93]|uniref:glycosyltransferase n=1 Tax=Streptosporangium sp. DT93 TaxID=3393428 RepID=UPI003CF8CA80